MIKFKKQALLKLYIRVKKYTSKITTPSRLTEMKDALIFVKAMAIL
ncbi:hypothetical protein [Caldicellulosiruptor morganii]|uniref:Uncharacterized protein n=1 Tax=Caldicellulosiruptor morganii TaxID=1387555 RepID=A0ABY7BN24_9FIRM|nr:hypothetical protein [Caldicellulosiruptor morganii]WAM33974.1 hypothetical protein OTK00_000117 [Caldicellulosiruptor morganii]